MPRGPGKKENYNLDYSRFSAFDGDDDVEEDTKSRNAKVEADAAGGPMPDMRDMLRTMPPELQEAYHLMSLGRQNGDKKAEQRAQELALKAISKGSPEVKESFMKNVGEQMPELVGKLSEDMASGVADDPAKLLAGLQDEATRHAAKEKLKADDSSGDFGGRVADLKRDMEEGQKATRKELENLSKKMEELERIRDPEAFFKFMQEGGMNQEDMQRILSGDEAHMQARFNETVDKSMSKGTEETQAASQKALRTVEELTSVLGGTPLEEPAQAEEAPKPAKKKAPAAPKEPEVQVPMYRLQYQKDESGKYTAVELKCSLPGVADMTAINLDVAERHLRIHTVAPAPKFAVNAGPFPVLIDPSGARAKYSKKREELSITVPAKA